MTSILTVLVTAFSALLGAWAGASVGLARFKRERTFEAQKDWYESLVKALFNTAAHLRNLRVAIEVGRPNEEVDLAQAPLGKSIAELREIADLAYIYGGSKSILALARAETALPSFVQGQQIDRAAFGAMARQYRSAVVSAAKDIAEEARKHLHLPPAPSLSAFFEAAERRFQVNSGAAEPPTETAGD